jgi:hypothetical protein
METAHVEARDAAAAVALVKMNQDQPTSFELLSVLLITYPLCTAETLVAS